MTPAGVKRKPLQTTTNSMRYRLIRTRLNRKLPPLPSDQQHEAVAFGLDRL